MWLQNYTLKIVCVLASSLLQVRGCNGSKYEQQHKESDKKVQHKSRFRGREIKKV